MRCTFLHQSKVGATALVAAIVTSCCGSIGPAHAIVGLADDPGKATAPDARPEITLASAKSRNGGVTPGVSNKPALVGTFGDWGVYVSQAPKSKICYALAQPKDRAPSSLSRDTAYVFISNRPGEGVRGEVSMIMGTPLKDGANGAKAEVGSAKFDLVAKGQNAFIRNAAEESQFVDTLRKRGSRLVIKVPLQKGPLVTDTYSLAGLSQALDRVGKECP